MWTVPTRGTQIVEADGSSSSSSSAPNSFCKVMFSVPFILIVNFSIFPPWMSFLFACFCSCLCKRSLLWEKEKVEEVVGRVNVQGRSFF